MSQGSTTASAERGKLLPLGSERYALQATISQETRDLLCRAQDLLVHQVRSDDLDELLKRALASLVLALEKKKFGGNGKPSSAQSLTRRRTTGGRGIPMHVRRAVVERDSGQCTFVSESGHRCEARRGVTREQREQEIAARAAAQERALDEFPWLREMKSKADADPQAPRDGPLAS